MTQPISGSGHRGRVPHFNFHLPDGGIRGMVTVLRSAVRAVSGWRPPDPASRSPDGGPSRYRAIAVHGYRDGLS